jgi:hypothetical protein
MQENGIERNVADAAIVFSFGAVLMKDTMVPAVNGLNES